MTMEMNVTGGANAAGSVPSPGYAPTYFPGTASGAEAQRITIAAGQDALDANISLVPVRLARIRGVVIGSDGKPVSGAMINAIPHRGDTAMGMMLGLSSPTNRDGTFTLVGVSPGDYILQSRSMRIMTSSNGDMMTSSPSPPEESESGSATVSVNGEDISNVVILNSRGATASGR